MNTARFHRHTTQVFSFTSSILRSQTNRKMKEKSLRLTILADTTAAAVMHFKGMVWLYMTFLHHVYTLMSFQTCMIFILLQRLLVTKHHWSLLTKSECLLLWFTEERVMT